MAVPAPLTTGTLTVSRYVAPGGYAAIALTNSFGGVGLGASYIYGFESAIAFDGSEIGSVSLPFKPRRVRLRLWHGGFLQFNDGTDFVYASNNNVSNFSVVNIANFLGIQGNIATVCPESVDMVFPAGLDKQFTFCTNILFNGNFAGAINDRGVAVTDINAALIQLLAVEFYK